MRNHRGRRCPKGRAAAEWLHSGFEVGDPGHPRNPYGARGGFSKPPLPQIWAQRRRVRNNIRFTPLPGGKEGERERCSCSRVTRAAAGDGWPTFPLGDPV